MDLAERIANAKEQSADKNYFKPNTEGVATLIALVEKKGFKGNSVLAFFKIETSSTISDGAINHRIGEKVCSVFKPDQPDKLKAEIHLSSMLALVKALLGAGKDAPPGELAAATRKIMDSSQLARGFQCKYKVVPSSKDPSKAYPRFDVVTDNKEVNKKENVKARREVLDKEFPVDTL